jgi:hypothetical protein
MSELDALDLGYSPAGPSSKSILRTAQRRDIYLGDPGSSVAVRDKNNVVEYLG